MPHRLTVTVLDSSGSPVSGASLVVQQPGQQPQTGVTPDKAMFVVQDNIVCGVGVQCTQGRANNTAPPATLDQDFVVTLAAPASYPVHLVFESASADAISWSIPGAGQAGTADVGHASAVTTVSLPAGSYSVEASQGQSTASQPFTVVGETSVAVSFAATADPNQQPPIPTFVRTVVASASPVLPAPDAFEYLYPPLSYDRYYTSAQVRIYIGNVFIDEANTVQFILQANKTPVYGYASRRPDAFGGGRSIVQGQLILNFVSQGYLYSVLQAYYAQQQSSATSRDQTQADLLSSTAVQAATALPNIPLQSTDLLRPSFLPSQLFPSAPTSAKKDVSDYVSSQLNNPAGAAADPLASFQDLLSQSSFGAIDRYKANRAQLNSAYSGGVSTNPAYLESTFDLLVEVGAGQSGDPGSSKTAYRFQRWIRNCMIISDEFISAPDGRVLFESYGFIARSVDVVPPGNRQ